MTVGVPDVLEAVSSCPLLFTVMVTAPVPLSTSCDTVMLFVALVSMVDAIGNTAVWFSLVCTVISVSDILTCTLLAVSCKSTVSVPKVLSLLLTSIEYENAFVVGTLLVGTVTPDVVNPKSNDTVLVVVSTTRGFEGASITTGLAPVDVWATKRG